MHNKLEEVVDKAIDGLAEISNNLSPHILQNFGLEAAVNNFIDIIAKSTDIDFNLAFDLAERPGENIELVIYRATTELINNSVKYSGADRINISIKAENDILRYHYHENGKGFDYDEAISKSKGMGMRNLPLRVDAVNGTFHINTTNGVEAEITVPLNLHF